MLKLAPYGIDLTTPDLRVPVIPDDALQQVISQASHLAHYRNGQCVMDALSPPRLFRRLAGRGTSFRGFTFWWVIQFALTLARCLTLQDSAPRIQ